MTFCSHCGGKIESTDKFCPECGEKIPSSVSAPTSVSSQNTNQSDTDNQPHARPAVKKKPMPFWFKLVTAIAVIALIGVTAAILITEKIVDVVDYQLAALKNENIEKAYLDYTSNDFKAGTSLEQFRHFIDSYPVFLNNQSTHFFQRSIENHIVILKGYLTSTDHINTPIEYKLIKENHKLKILIIRLLKPEAIHNPSHSHDHGDLIEVIKNQLKAIENQNLSEAYKDYSSNEFKEATSEEVFGEFIKRYPILTQLHVSSYHKPSIRNGIGTISVIVRSDQGAAYIRYYLIYEDHHWKIWSMRIISPSEEASIDDKNIISQNELIFEEPIHFGYILIGDHIDSNGLITDPQTQFETQTNELFFDILIENGHNGHIVYFTLQNLENDFSIPAQAVIEETGYSILKSAFKSPPDGWSKGTYLFQASTANGQSTSVEFEMI
ncbi:MAG: DUF4864 domain-containing protein [Parachlamydiaceae bacterium]|nr:DUF4864 domain-containing protein [Parachlamydiaceae bacterium]